MNLIEITATKRSGHHAIMSWIVENLTGVKIHRFEFKLTIANGTNFAVLNDGNNHDWLGKKLIDEMNLDLETLMVNYEDENYDFTLFGNEKKFMGKFNVPQFTEKKFTTSYRAAIIRDFYNTISSRYHSNITGFFPHTYGKDFIEIWKNHARNIVENNSHYIKFEDWLNDKTKRNEFLLNLFGVYDRVSIENVGGTPSSFGDKKNVLKRHETVDLPDEIKDLIRKDNELHYLIGKLGYEYIKL